MKIREHFEDAVDLIKQDPEPILLGNLIGMVLAAASFGLFTGPYLCGVFHICLKSHRGQRPEVRDVFHPMERFADQFVAGAIFAIAFALGFSVHVIGALPVAGLLIWTFPLLVDRRLRWDQALIESLSLARRDYAGILPVVALAYLVGWGGMVPAGLGWLLWSFGHPWLGGACAALGLVLTAFLMPFTHAVVAVVYEDVVSDLPESMTDASWIR